MARVLSLGGLFIIFYTDYYNNLLIQGYSFHMNEHWLEWFSTAVLCDALLVSVANPSIVTLKCCEMNYRWIIVQLTNAQNTTFSTIYSRVTVSHSQVPSQSVGKSWTTHMHS